MAPRSCQTPRACNEPPPLRESLRPEGSPSTPAMGSYRLLQRLGGDHVTSIYRGFDTSLERPVAIRILNPEAAGHKELAGRFQAEAAAAAGVGHPNVVAIHFVGDEAGCPYYVMHFVEGEPLASRLSRQECLAPPVAMEITRQCLAGLAAAHQRRIVHGGLHPGKILLEEPSSRAMLVDLGRLRQTARDTRTSPAAVLYMPPELARGEPPDARSDLYAMGVVLYRMLAGRSPFEAQSPADVLYQITHGTPLPLEEAAPNLPAEVRSIVRRLMVRDPAGRYQTASEALADVQAVIAGWADGGIVWAEAVHPAGTADDEALYQRLDRLAGGKPWQRARDWAATMLRRHAPQFIQQLETTTRQADGAIAACQRRCDRLVALLAEGELIAADLTEPEALAAHEEQLAALRAELVRLGDTLDRLRRQRDILAARVKKAEEGRRRPPAPKKPSRRTRTLIALAAGLLLLLVLEQLVSVFPVARVRFNAWRARRAESQLALELQRTRPIPIPLPAAPPADLMSQNVVHFTFEPDTVVPSGPYLLVKDSSGRGNHGVLIGPKQFDEGRVGKALVFPQDGLRIDLPALDSMAGRGAGDPLSVSVWVRQSRYTEAAAIFAGLACLAENRSVVFQPFHDTEKVEARDVSAEQWHHLVAVWDAVSTSLYVDGRLADRKQATGRIDRQTPFRAAFALGSQKLLGRAPGFIGLMDEFTLFERPLFQQEVETLYQQGIQGRRPPLPTGPVSVENYWTRLDEYHRDKNLSGLSPDGKAKLEIGHWGRIWQTDIATGDTLACPQLPVNGHAIHAMSFSPDGRWAALLGMTGTVSLWDLRQQKLGREFHTPLASAHAAAFTPDMARIAIGGKVRASHQNPAAISVWEVADGKAAGEFQVPSIDVRALAYSPDGQRLCSIQKTSQYSTVMDVCLLRSEDGQVIGNLGKWTTFGLPSLQWLPDNARVLVSGPSGQVRLFDVGQGDGETLFSEDHRIQRLELVAGGRIVVGIANDTLAVLWDIAEKKELGRIAIPNDIGRILSLDPKTLTLMRNSGAIQPVAVPVSIQGPLARILSPPDE